jgi:hypothetical protein
MAASLVNNPRSISSSLNSLALTCDRQQRVLNNKFRILPIIKITNKRLLVFSGSLLHHGLNKQRMAPSLSRTHWSKHALQIGNTLHHRQVYAPFKSTKNATYS